MKEANPAPAGYIRLRDVPERYGISASMLRKEWSAGRGCRYSKIGRITLIRVADIESWIERNARGPEAAA